MTRLYEADIVRRENLRGLVEQMVIELHAAQAVVPPVGSFRTMLLKWQQIGELVVKELNEHT